MQQRVKRGQNTIQNKKESRKRRARRLRRIYFCEFGLVLIFMVGVLVYAKRPDLNKDSQVTEKPETEQSAEVSDQPAEEQPDAKTEDDADDPDAESKGQSGEKGEYDYSVPVPESDEVTKSYFDDAVFIGDSRTEGFMLSAGLSNATFYSHKGITVSTVFTEPAIKMGNSKVSIMDALAKTDFSKVYIMLGINETGWVYSSMFIEKYAEIVDEIKKINPDAVIYVQQILPVSQKVSEEHRYIKNKRIRKYNTLLQEMAEEKEVYFVDVAKAVEDENRVLPEDAAVDGIHLKKDYCKKWLEYLETHVVE
ncbi:MAG: GDSL-type esterase/lipase family protein [Lachnospiraceae bacterium]